MSARSVYKNIMASGWPGVLAWETEKTEESLNLEFKGKDHENVGLTDKDWPRLAEAMSAFANSDGGVFVLGPYTTDGGKKFPDRVRSIKPLSNVRGIQGRIQGRIHELTDPPIRGITVDVIESAPDSDSGVVVIYVPRSESVPHRVAQKGGGGTYYMRTEVSTVPMSHAVLAEMFGRRPTARLYLAVLYSLSRHLSSIEVLIGNMGRGYAERPAVSFVQHPDDPKHPDRGGALLWHMISPSRGWDKVVCPAGGKDNSGTIVRAEVETVLYPGMEMPLGIVEATSIPKGRQVLHLAVDGVLYALNSSPARFRLVQDLAIEGHDMHRAVGRIEIPMVDDSEPL